MPNDEPEGSAGAGLAVVRRAPFSDNPIVGVRGLRTQQRILDAALQAFGEHGYPGCSVDRIMKVARCSRVTFYQYFASKDDVFRELAGRVARQVSASTESLDSLTDDAQGWEAMRAWIARYAEIHSRYAPVFHALESDDELAAAAWRTGRETVARIHARLSSAALPPRQLEPVITLLLECANHSLDISAILRSVAPGTHPRDQVEIALTDVLHRSLFGLRPSVNVHEPRDAPPPALTSGPEMRDLFREDLVDGRRRSGNGVLDALVGSGRTVFVERGFHNARIDDLVAAAGVSHGAFYRHFRNKDQLARRLTAAAVQSVARAVLEMPDVTELDEPTGRTVLRKWLRSYHSAHSSEAAMLRVWVDAAHQDPALRADSAPLLDWGRRRMSRYLRPRGFGDIDTEAVVMVALLGVFGARPRPATDVDAAAHVIDCGLLGRRPGGVESS
jgi:AcrR family transcriptional regulator